MTDSTARVVIALTLQLFWFLGQALVFFFLWNFAATSFLDVAKLSVLQSVAAYALLRLIIDPPKLRIELD